ncbi:MAG: peptidylprolyl isomerase [Kiritimatiellia bacterium]|jgi:cyclophilin family peptidyl-prolyl cis-trans isomerase
MKWMILGLAMTLASGPAGAGQDAAGQPPIPEEMEEVMVAAEPAAELEKDTNMVLIKTTLGDIQVKLAADKAPITVANFLAYVDSGHYNGTIFHRVIDGFMIQGGGFDANMVQKPTRAPIKNEAANGLSNKRGTLAMARTSVVDSATSQFFINVKDNGFLDFRAPNPQGFGYCVFGEVVAGMDVVDKIKVVKTRHLNGMDDVPAETVEILAIERMQ